MGWRDVLGWPATPPLQAETRSGSPSAVSLSANPEDLYAFFGMMNGSVQLPVVTIESALEVPAVFGTVGFLSRTLAALPLQAFLDGKGGTEKLDGDLAMLLNEAPNPEWSSFGWRQYFWQQVFTGGRGLSWIERSGSKVLAIWPMDPLLTKVKRRSGRRIYEFDGREYPAADVIDVPFMLRANQVDCYGPIFKARKAIQLAIAMSDFAGTFFAGGGVPPMALEGPLPSGPEAFKRAAADIQRAIDLAKKSGSSFFPMPPGHALKAIGFDPAKGQMTEARLFQIQEIARAWGLPPVFVQDLSHGTFSNTEQQDLQLVKHNIGQWAKALEDELNLKLFGQRKRTRRVKHNLDGLQRGDFKSRIEGLARAIQTAQLTPNEARALEDRPPLENGGELLVQGATVPLGTQPLLPSPNDTNQKDPANAGTAAN